MDIIILIFLAWHIGNKAREKGLNVFRWRLRMVLTWLGFELAGLVLGILLFGYDKNNMLGLAAFALVCAFGSFLLVKAALDKTDHTFEDDNNNPGKP